MRLEDLPDSATRVMTGEDLCLLCLLSQQDAPCQPLRKEEPLPEHSEGQMTQPVCSSPEDPRDRKQAWGDRKRTAHGQACVGKKRLTLLEKAEIIRLYYGDGQEQSAMKQMTIAETYGKSRAAISKLLRPESAVRVMVRFAAKRAYEDT